MCHTCFNAVYKGLLQQYSLKNMPIFSILSSLETEPLGYNVIKYRLCEELMYLIKNT